MSKGNLFLGYARGKVGSVVFSRLYGQQVTRAYNGSPANPKTTAQATQRMLFSSISQYYKSFRYLVEQGQQGIQTGQASIRAWQSKSLKTLAGLLDSSPMMPNVKGVQFPQLLPISLTDGNLSSLDYSITGKTNQAGDTHYALTLLMKGNYTTTAALANMTLGDFYSLYPGIQKGAQLTFVALAWSMDYEILDLGNRQYQPIWAQFVLAPDADETLSFFTLQEGSTTYYTINPAILQSSWGERFTPRISLELINGKAVARVDDAAFITDGSVGLMAGAVITSYYNGTQWARSYSPFAIAAGYGSDDIPAIIATYQRATKSTKSNLYLNQSRGAAKVYQYDSLEVEVVREGGQTIVLQNITTLDSTIAIVADNDQELALNYDIYIRYKGASFTLDELTDTYATTGSIGVDADYTPDYVGARYGCDSAQEGATLTITLKYGNTTQNVKFTFAVA